MKKLITLLWPFLFVFQVFAADEDVNQSIPAADTLQKEYLGSKNPFLKVLKQREELESLKTELEQLNKELKKKKSAGNAQAVQELEDRKQIVESKVHLLSQGHQEVYQRITTVTTGNEPFNLPNFFTRKPLKDADKAINSLMAIKEEHQQAHNRIRQYAKQLKEQIQTIEDQPLKKAYKQFYSDVLQDQRYLVGFKELIDKQYEHLMDERSNIEKRYFEYRDRELLRHFISISVIIVLIIVTYLLRRVTERYIKDDERQFILKRTISTSASIVALTFLIIFYSESIIYSLTVFTFIGAALILASRGFLLNIIGWIYISMSNFIKVGDRVLIPHETKYYYGDIINISPVKITLYEAYDFSSTKEAVSAGRIIFIPNSYVFSHAIISYSHHAQKTVFDNIAINLSLESDLKKAEAITREVLKEQTSQYLDEAKKQFSSLKNRYDIKQRMLEPEVQFALNPTSTAIKMTAWYMTPSLQSASVKNRLLETLLKRIGAEPSVTISRKAKTDKEATDGSTES